MKNPRILIVAIAESIHTARWLKQLTEIGWEIFLFPSYDDGVARIHKDLLKNDAVKVLVPFQGLFLFLKSLGLGKIASFLRFRIFHLNQRVDKEYYDRRLSRVIKKYKPDLVHSLETQKAGYLVSNVKIIFFKTTSFPVWWHTNWGSDIFLLGRIPHQKPLIRQVMENCDYYSCECKRDIGLAQQFGFRGIAFDPYPNTGGFEPDLIDDYRNAARSTSLRKVIMVKGYQGWAGRALVAIRALERCGEIIRDYNVVIYSNVSGEDIEIASTLLSQNTGAEVTILPLDTPHAEIMRYHSLARISIGLSMGDAISTSLLEAMAMGSFPIQSCTACASEWFTDGVSGIIVSPEDPEVVEKAIRKVLIDDILVNSAAEINYNKIVKDANFEILKAKTIQAYKKVLNIDHVQ
jgi:glycosyltransferase involved in cell wall biosynthesis